MSQKQTKNPIYTKIEKNEQYMRDNIGLEKSYDVEFREIIILKRKVQLYFVNGLCDSSSIQQIMRQLVEINDFETNTKKVPEIVENRIINEQLERTKSLDETVDQMLSGLLIVFVDGIDYAFIVDVRNYPGRPPKEPDTEHVVRGSRDGYTENIIENTALTRRRIRDARLRQEILKVGERSKTDICLSYISDIADPDLVKEVKERLAKIEVDGLSMTDKTIEEFIIDPKWKAYPLVRYTERPDVAATHVMEGHILIIVDTSPSVIILPATFFHHVQHAEEYRETPLVGTIIRWSRFIAIMLSIFLLPFWLLLATDPSLLPKELSFIGPKEQGNIPIALQLIMADLGIEFLRMAAIYTPTPLATSMGLIAAVLIGQIAIDVGMFGPETILYVSISAVGIFVTPSYELGVANKIARWFLIAATALFGSIGFVAGVTVYMLYMIQIRTLRTPYLWPFIPFHAAGLKAIVFRVPKPYSNKRPDIVHPRNDYRQPKP
ncbi:spore germination protein SpoVAF [Barrientosiimonas marina]|uniref:Spore germination protein n=1 Tax=Lentibacillus kimchii TaxID=1542911 RepID=A0ABW2V027_9BACI